MTNKVEIEGGELDIPGWFWAVAGLALVWNLLGVIAFVMHLMIVGTPEMLDQLPEAQKVLYSSLPGWLDYAFGAAVLGGTLGCVGLLIRNAFALVLFVISLAGVLVQNYYTFFQTDLLSVQGNSSIIQPLAVIMISIGLILFSYKMKARGILK